MNPFEDMRIFCQVMDSGSFTAAADQLGLSKQFVSRRLMQLEERLGVRLLNRSTRRLDVTPLGQSYYESALRLLSEVEQVEQGIAGQTVEPRGTIRLSAPLSFAMAHLGELLPLFLQRYRDVAVEVDLSDRPVDLLGEGYDLALRIGVLEDSTLIARRIASIQRVYCASPAYRRARHAAQARGAARPRLPALRPRPAGAVAFRRAGQQALAGQRHRQDAGQQRRIAQGRRHRRHGHHLPADLHRRGGAQGRATGVAAGRLRTRAPGLVGGLPPAPPGARPVQVFIEFLREQLNRGVASVAR